MKVKQNLDSLANHTYMINGKSYYLGHHRDMSLQIKHLYILDALKNKTHNSNIQHIITA